MGNKDSAICVFRRVEKKYLLSTEQYCALMEKITPFIVPDKYARYTICNIYYDTDHFDLIRRSVEKPEYKEKLRLRSYGVPNGEDKAFIEIKKKYKGVVYKRRVKCALREAEQYLRTGQKPENAGQILNEIDYFMKFYHPVPKLYLAYDREAYFAADNPELRITFDRNIRSRETELNLSAGDSGNYLLKEGQYLMEIKAAYAFPLWLVKTLSELEIYPVSFSKYGKIYTNSIIRRNESCLQVYSTHRQGASVSQMPSGVPSPLSRWASS